MRFRYHRGGLGESLETTFHVSSYKELAEALSTYWQEEITEERLKVKHMGYDDRCDWDTYYVNVEGMGMVGMSDAPKEDGDA